MRRQRFPLTAVGMLTLLGIACAPATSPEPTPPTTPPSMASSPSARPSSSVAPPGLEPIVAADPDYRQKLSAAGLRTGAWKTDFSRYTVPFSEIVSGGPPPDGIPPIDQPRFVTPDEADEWIGPLEPVIVFQIGDDARAYPLQIMTWHEIVNDEVGGVPVTVTFCPLCNSAIAFDRRLDGQVLDFGTSGNVRFSDLVMYDRQTESWWQQLTGEAIVGSLAGYRLTFLPAAIASWEEFRSAHPDGLVLSRDTGASRPYGQNPYSGYDRVDNPPFLFRGDLDGRLLPKERVAAVAVDGVDVAFPYSALEAERVVNYVIDDTAIAVFYTPGTLSALDRSSIQDSRSVGATGVFEAELDGQRLTFRAEGDRIIDDQTDSSWSVLGEAIDGELRGKRLTRIVHGDHFWFAWAAFKPDTIVYPGTGT